MDSNSIKFNGNQDSFFISDSFYKVEYETPFRSIDCFQDIAEWNIKVSKKLEFVTTIDVIIYFSELLKYYPWIFLKKFGIRNEKNAWLNNSGKSLLEYFIELLNKENLKDNIEWDLVIADCSLKMNYNDKTFTMLNKNELSIYIFYDPDYKELFFTFILHLDVFFKYPSKMSDVTLTEEQVEFNRAILEKSLRDIDESDTFEINYFNSKFYPNEVSKYGF